MGSEIVDNGDLRKYRTEIPNLIDEMDLSVYAFRLYVHLKRVAGDTGKCFEGRRKMAETCKMSPASITNAKRELVEAGLISVEPGSAAENRPDNITINDIWGINFVRFSNPGHYMTSPGHHIEHPGHHIEHPGHHIEHPGHQVEPKKEPIKKEPIKKEQRERDLTPQLAPKPAQATAAPALPKRRGRVTKDSIDPRKLMGGMIPAGTGTTPVEIHREFFDWSIPAEGLSRFNCQVITDEIKDLDKWRQVCRSWAERGYRGGNREGLQEWYRGANQSARKEKSSAESRAQEPVDGWHPGLVKEWKPEREYSFEEISEWVDSLEDRVAEPAVRQVRQRAGRSTRD